MTFSELYIGFRVFLEKPMKEIAVNQEMKNVKNAHNSATIS